MADPVSFETRRGLGLATVMARKGVAGDRIAAALNLAPSSGAAWSGGPDLALVGTGPGVWLAIADERAGTDAERLRQVLGALASVVDQSGAYVAFRISGPGARTVLQRGAPVDLHPSVFGTGAAATTVIAHIGVVLRRLDDTPTFEVLVFRSYADAFSRWLDAAIHAL